MPARTRASTLCFHENKLLVVKLEDPLTRIVRHFPPGGEVELNESPIHAAERETLEETGYRVRGLPHTESIVEYTFQWAGVTYDCRTYFYLAKLIPGAPIEPVNDAHYHRGVSWLPQSDVVNEFAFHSGLQTALTSFMNKWL